MHSAFVYERAIACAYERTFAFVYERAIVFVYERAIVFVYERASAFDQMQVKLCRYWGDMNNVGMVYLWDPNHITRRDFDAHVSVVSTC